MKKINVTLNGEPQISEDIQKQAGFRWYILINTTQFWHLKITL